MMRKWQETAGLFSSRSQYMKKDSQEEAIIADFQNVLEQPVEIPSHEGPSLRSFTENLDFAPWKVETDFKEETARIEMQAAEKAEQQLAAMLSKVQVSSTDLSWSHLRLHDDQGLELLHVRQVTLWSVAKMLQECKRAKGLRQLDLSMNLISSDGASKIGEFLGARSTC
eukprot:334985-Hanusia_phi.AAC.4